VGDEPIDLALIADVADKVHHILADNHAMLAFVRHLGFTLGHRPNERDVVEARLRIQPGSRPR
jgi:acetyltransferase